MYLDTFNLRKSLLQQEDKWQRLVADIENGLEESLREILFHNNYKVKFPVALNPKDTDLNFKVTSIRFNKIEGSIELTGLQGRGIFAQSIENYGIENLSVYQLLLIYEEVAKTLNYSSFEDETEV